MANLLTLDSSKTEFLLTGLKQQLAKLHNCLIETTNSACNLGILFDEHLSFCEQISALSKSCYSHICELRCIRPYLDFETATTIDTSTVHSKLEYCSSLYFYDLSTKFSDKSTPTNPNLSCPHCCQISQVLSRHHVLNSLRWLKVKERIE